MTLNHFRAGRIFAPRRGTCPSSSRRGPAAGMVAVLALALAAFRVSAADSQTPAPPAAPGPLQAQAEALVSNPDEWGLMAYSLDRNEVLFAINADRIRVPASNNKVYSSIWALELLGPDHRFHTDMLVAGEVQNGVLRGDVYLRGTGDPAFGYPEYDKNPLDAVRGMAQALRRLGVQRVEGSIVGDGSLHTGPNYGPGWPLDTGNGAARYAPTVSALPYQRNIVWVEVRGGVPTTEPLVPEIPVLWERRSGAGMAVRKPEEDTLRIRGSASGPGPHRYPVGAFEPALLAPAALRAALLEAGISVSGPVRVGATPPDARLVHQRYSIPLAALIPKLNQESDNFFAEHVWKAAVAKAAGASGFMLGGAASANFFHRFAGVPYGELWQADGSGLSAYNQSTANAFVLALRAADRAPWGEVFRRSLAVAGDPDGTLGNMFAPATPAGGNLHAKTGYIRQVRTLSGYVRTAGGERVAFSMLYNGRNTGGARAVQQNLGNLLAEYRR